MIKHIAAALRPHKDMITLLGARDQHMVVGVTLLFCGLIFFLGSSVIALTLVAYMAVTETTFRLIAHKIGPFGRMDTDRVLLLSLGLLIANTAAYAIPGIVLAAQPSVALKFCGILLIVGVLIYITNTWMRVSMVVFSMLSTNITTLAGGFFALGLTEPTASPPSHWGLAWVCLVLFIYSSIDTLRQHVVVQRDLLRAQTQSAARLRLLEEAHRLDAMTGVLNRAAFDTAVNTMLADRTQMGGQIAVFLVDLDSFKPINDTYSHEAGDAVLIEIAKRLEKMCLPSGVVGRLGGDEFICALSDLSHADDVMTFAQQIASAIAQPITWGGRNLKVMASIGAACTISTEATSVTTLCSGADQAMFAAKSATAIDPVIYDAALFASRMSAQDKQLLVQGVANKAVRPYYQPKIHLPTGRIVGFEALARWEHPTGTVLSPDDFLDQIGELGLQGEMMFSMARQVVADVNALLKDGLDPGQVSLNIAEVTLATYSGRKDLEALLETHPDVAPHITLEITEDVFIARAADMIQTSIARFNALGVRISLDDFGTGFASFHHLRQLHFDELKIDTSFVAGLGHDTTADVLVQGFLDIASGLGVSVIAEGVETEDQSRILINMGCHAAQGFLFCEAVPFDDARARLKDQHANDP